MVSVCYPPFYWVDTTVFAVGGPGKFPTLTFCPTMKCPICTAEELIKKTVHLLYFNNQVPTLAVGSPGLQMAAFAAI